jgi:hypothetical protein
VAAPSETFALDTNIYDKIVDDPAALALVQRLTRAGKIKLFVTHVQEDEIANAPPARRRTLSAVPREVVATHGFIIGESRLDMARLGEEAPIEAMRGTNWAKRTRDALIAVTARGEGHTLVSEDGDLRTRAQTALGLTPWDWQQFYAHLRALDT